MKKVKWIPCIFAILLSLSSSSEAHISGVSADEVVEVVSLFVKETDIDIWSIEGKKITLDKKDGQHISQIKIVSGPEELDGNICLLRSAVYTSARGNIKWKKDNATYMSIKIHEGFSCLESNPKLSMYIAFRGQEPSADEFRKFSKFNDNLVEKSKIEASIPNLSNFKLEQVVVNDNQYLSTYVHETCLLLIDIRKVKSGEYVYDGFNDINCQR